VLAIAAGFHAYFTVNHDTSTHVQMIKHKNLALTTMTLFSITVIWLMISWQKKVLEKTPIVVLMFFAAITLFYTAWSGGDLVFRYGLGVLALPDTDGHAHGSSDQHTHLDDDESSSSDFSLGVRVLPSDSHNQLHEHDIDHEHEGQLRNGHHDSL